MTKPKGKRTKVKKIEDVKRRSAVAVAAFLRSGGGKHQDRRFRRNRTRQTQQQAAIADY